MGIPRTKNIEKAGRSIESIVVKKDPWFILKGGCGRNNCYIENKGVGIKCTKESVNYSVQCKLCEMKEMMIKYIGETGKTSYERVFQHIYAFKQKKEPNVIKKTPGSVLWEHSKEVHNGSMKVGDWLPKVTLRS